MLSGQRNKLLCETGPGTPMGELLRRYWMPIAGASEFERRIKAVRLMGEDLVLYRDLGGNLRPRRPALPAPARRPVLRLRRGVRAALQLPRLALRRRPATASSSRSRRSRHPDARLQGQDRDQRLSGRGQGRAALGLHGAAARAAAARLGTVHLDERLRADRLLRDPVQLAAVPGKLDRSGALRVDAPQLEHARCAARPAAGARAPQDRLRRVRVRLHLPPRAARTRRGRRALDDRAASACGRTASSPAATSNGACRSTTRTR